MAVATRAPRYRQKKMVRFLNVTFFDQIFRCLPDERVEGGDFEKNDGTGGHSAFTERDFLAEQVVK